MLYNLVCVLLSTMLSCHALLSVPDSNANLDVTVVSLVFRCRLYLEWMWWFSYIQIKCFDVVCQKCSKKVLGKNQFNAWTNFKRINHVFNIHFNPGKIAWVVHWLCLELRNSTVVCWMENLGFKKSTALG